MRLIHVFCILTIFDTYSARTIYIKKPEEQELCHSKQKEINKIALRKELEEFCTANHLILAETMKIMILERCCRNHTLLADQKNILRCMLTLRLAIAEKYQERYKDIIPTLREFLDNPMQTYSEKLQKKITYVEALNALNKLIATSVTQILREEKYFNAKTKKMRSMAFWIGYSDMMHLSARHQKYLTVLKTLENSKDLYNRKTDTFNKNFTEGDMIDLMKEIDVYLDELLLIWIIEALPNECKILAHKVLHVTHHSNIMQLLRSIITKAISQNIYIIDDKECKVMGKNFYRSKFLFIHNAELFS